MLRLILIDDDNIMDALQLAQTRYTAKAYNPNKKIPKEQLDKLLEVLRLAPSSINIQPWHFIVAQSDQAKQKIAHAMPDNFAYNIPKVLNASEVIIFTAKTNIDETHLNQIISAEDELGRFRTSESKKVQHQTRLGYVNLYKQKDITRWIDNQLHIALGTALLAAQSFEVNATPIGGFDAQLLDEQFNLAAQGLRSVVILALGYSHIDDFNAELPKGRLAKEDIIDFV